MRHRKTIEKIYKTGSWNSEKIREKDKPFPKLTKKKERIQKSLSSEVIFPIWFAFA